LKPVYKGNLTGQISRRPMHTRGNSAGGRKEEEEKKVKPVCNGKFAGRIITEAKAHKEP
jgi:hypothetical protein